MRDTLRVIIAGYLDGWREPYDLSTSTNVESLLGYYTPDLQQTLDMAINIGQLARAGRKSQVWVENFWPVNVLRKMVNK